MKTYVIKLRDSGQFVDMTNNGKITTTPYFYKAWLFTSLTFAIEFADKNLTESHDICEIILKKV